MDTKFFYTEIETNSPCFLYSSQMLSVSTFTATADIYAIMHFVPHPCQHITVDQSHSSGDTVTKIPEINIVYLLWIFKMFHGLMNNPVLLFLFMCFVIIELFSTCVSNKLQSMLCNLNYLLIHSSIAFTFFFVYEFLVWFNYVRFNRLLS
jgi:hypothetical protein